MRIAYIILTCEKYFDTRVKWQKQTSLLNVKQEDIYYLGHTMDPDRRLYNWGASDENHTIPNKCADFFKNMDLNYDFYILIEDDTYVFHNKVHRTLAAFLPTMHIAMGRIMDHDNYDPFQYYSGGAGIVLSHALYKRICNYVRSCPNPIVHWCADICLGKWLIDIKKSLKETTIFIYELNNPNFHIDLYNPLKDNISKALTFHHVKTHEQYDELGLHEYAAQVIN